jgi:hypothetical protein
MTINIESQDAFELFLRVNAVPPTIQLCHQELTFGKVREVHVSSNEEYFGTVFVCFHDPDSNFINIIYRQ